MLQCNERGALVFGPWGGPHSDHLWDWVPASNGGCSPGFRDGASQEGQCWLQPQASAMAYDWQLALLVAESTLLGSAG